MGSIHTHAGEIVFCVLFLNTIDYTLSSYHTKHQYILVEVKIITYQQFLSLKFQIQLRIQNHNNTHHNTAITYLSIPSLHTLYTTYILPPHTLYVYRTCTILGLPYLNFGTLVNALRVLMLKGGAFFLCILNYLCYLLNISS